MTGTLVAWQPAKGIASMLMASSLLPDFATLSAGLRSVFNGTGATGGGAIVVKREPNPYAGRARSEIVTCRWPDGRPKRLLIKYEDKDGQSWSDVAYEAAMYSEVLRNVPVSTPAFYGTYIDPTTGRLWLVIDYLDAGVSLAEQSDTAGMVLAARWAGRFHAVAERLLAASLLPFLKRFDLPFYERYVNQTLCACTDPRRFPWLELLARRFAGFVGPLWTARPTVSHGDYAPYNLIVRDGIVFPVDWELAGIDLGELDLAFLIDGWPTESRRRCVDEYQRARWPGGAPPDFNNTLGAARLCLYFYKLGGQADWTSDTQSLWYSKQLQDVGEKLGLI